jgi:fused signal recognition particle receptor
VNEPRERKRGFLGRLFGGREAVPVEADKPPAEVVARQQPAAPLEDRSAEIEGQRRSQSPAAEPPAAEPVTVFVQPTVEPNSREVAAAQPETVEQPVKASWFQRLRTGFPKASRRSSPSASSMRRRWKISRIC